MGVGGYEIQSATEQKLKSKIVFFIKRLQMLIKYTFVVTLSILELILQYLKRWNSENFPQALKCLQIVLLFRVLRNLFEKIGFLTYTGTPWHLRGIQQRTQKKNIR